MLTVAHVLAVTARVPFVVSGLVLLAIALAELRLAVGRWRTVRRSPGANAQQPFRGADGIVYRGAGPYGHAAGDAVPGIFDPPVPYGSDFERPMSCQDPGYWEAWKANQEAKGPPGRSRYSSVDDLIKESGAQPPKENA